MITDLRHCTEQELQAQIKYLEGTPVRGIAQLLRTGQCVLKRGSVPTLTQLGALKTEFGQIGSLVPNATDGETKFRVAELVPLLRNNPGIDDGLLAKIEAFVEKDKRGEVEYNVTIFDHGNDLVIKDGNKRTVAFFERRKGSSNDAIGFPVFIVQQDGHRAQPDRPTASPLGALVVSLLGGRLALTLGIQEETHGGYALGLTLENGRITKPHSLHLPGLTGARRAT